MWGRPLMYSDIDDVTQEACQGTALNIDFQVHLFIVLSLLLHGT
jgi:hypothetical protein